MSFLQIENLGRRYAGATVFRGLRFGIDRGEFACIIG
ncbi:MAG: ABC transporter ATP-binding protein, partial [Betaproteobacteria bacterium]|nr:ABC transporter ATP-binding protein [Betaproteobacteria bacterium]